MRILRTAAAAAALCLLFTGCQEPRSKPSPAVVGQVGAGSTGGTCPSPGPNVAKVLPDLTGSGIRTVLTNPCIPFSGLVSAVLDVTGQEDQVKKTFRPVLTDFVNKVANANSAVTCAYRTDHLGVRTYQQDGYATSVGIAVVLSHDPGAVIDIAKCYVADYFGIPSDPGIEPVFEPCWRTAPVGGGTFTMVWAGSTRAVCDALEASAS